MFDRGRQCSMPATPANSYTPPNTPHWPERRVFDLAAMDHVTHGNLGDFARAGPRNVVHGNHFGGRMPGGCALANAGFDKLD